MDMAPKLFIQYEWKCPKSAHGHVKCPSIVWSFISAYVKKHFILSFLSGGGGLFF